MKTILTTVAASVLSLALIASGPGEKKEALNVNTKKSTVFWTGKKVTGEHTGTLMLKSGSVDVLDSKPVGASLILDMNTIVVTDIKDPGTNAKLLGHLKSDDFFGVEKFAEGSFEATSFEPIEGAKDREPNYTVTGNLTLKGVTHEVSFPAMIAINGNKLVANGSAVFDRTKWNIRYGSGSFFEDLGDKAIYDEVELTFVLSANI
jgi:polyisoprenoid-binding protein YceI